MFHRPIRRQPRGEPCATDADDDAIGGREQGDGVVERLTKRGEDTDRVQRNIDDATSRRQ
jgi:hypothetical protein